MIPDEIVYIAKSLEIMHPDTKQPLIKIGLSKKGALERMMTLSSSGVPGKYECLYYLSCNNPFEVETYMQSIFEDLRYKKEFYTVNPESASKALALFPGEFVKFSDEVQKPIRKKRRKKPTPEPTQEQKDKIVRYHKRKRTQEDISKITKVSLHHVSKTIKQYETDIATFKMQGRIDR